MRIYLERGPHGTYLIKAEDGRDLLIQTDWDRPSVASTFGWRGKFSKKKYGTGPSAEIHAATDWLDDNIDAEADDPGYFDGDAEDAASEPGAMAGKHHGLYILHTPGRTPYSLPRGTSEKQAIDIASAAARRGGLQVRVAKGLGVVAICDRRCKPLRPGELHEPGASATFHCVDCGQDKPVHTGTGGTGYGQYGGKKVCYACAAKRDAAYMTENGKISLYLSKDEQGNWKVTNWPGSLSFDAFNITKGRHALAKTKIDVDFRGPDGQLWHGTQYGENTQIVHTRRVKGRHSHHAGEPGWESSGQRVAPHMWVISKDGTGAYIVSIGDPSFKSSTLKRRFSGKDKKAEMAEWVRDNVGTAVSRSHIVDWTFEFLKVGSGAAAEPGAARKKVPGKSLPIVHAGECVLLILTAKFEGRNNYRRVYLVVHRLGIVVSIQGDARGIGAIKDLGPLVANSLRQSAQIELVVPVSTYKSALKLPMRASLLPGIGSGNECLVAHLDAGRDRNGNPKRLFMVFDREGPIAAVDEGYEGPHAMDTELGPAVGARLRAMLHSAARIVVQPGEYSEWLSYIGPGKKHRRDVKAVCHEPGAASDKSKARRWMRQRIGQWETLTELAEQAADDLNLYEADGHTIPEWLFELSGELQPTK